MRFFDLCKTTAPPQVLLIQRTFRGFLGRERARTKRRELNEHLRLQYFNVAAMEIQRHWRGYVVRRRVLDFYQRKAFIRGILEQNARVRNEATAEQETASLHMTLEATRKEEQALTGTLSRLHFMLSTCHREGPLQAPMLGSLGLEPMASVSGQPVESVVRETARLRRQGTLGVDVGLPPVQQLHPRSTASKAALSRTNNPRESPLFRQTVRNSEAYGELQQLHYIEHRANQRAIAGLHGKDFIVGTGRVNASAGATASGSPRSRVQTSHTRFPPLSTANPYKDPVNYLMKGTRKDEPSKHMGPGFRSSIRAPANGFDDSLVA